MTTRYDSTVPDCPLRPASEILFAVFGTIALTYRIWSPWLIALVGSLFVVDTRLILGVHWFSDVAFGLVFGMTWGVTVAIVARQVEWADLVAIVRPPPRQTLDDQTNN
jgi:membrane-associated phospholipid phosphatase